MKKSVALIELRDKLGGHTSTYTDPSTGTAIDYGVQAYYNYTTTTNFFAHFNIPLFEISPPSGPTQYVDLRTGETVPGYPLTNTTDALRSYSTQAAKYPYLAKGWDIPNPVPEDLTIPFGDFITKYDLAPGVTTIYQRCSAIGYLLTKPTAYVLKTFGLPNLKALATNGFVTTANHNSSEVYSAAANKLGNNLFLNSRVLSTDRSAPNFTKILITTPAGLKIIQAKAIILSIPPLIDNLTGFGLSASDTELFSQFTYTGQWTGIIRNSGLKNQTTVINYGSDTPYNLPIFPAVVTFKAIPAPDLNGFYYTSPVALSDSAVQSDVIAGLNNLKTAGQDNTTTTEAELVAFESHTPYQLSVTGEQIRDGFDRKLHALQGQRNTWYTGAAFHTHFTSLLWDFTEDLLGRVLQQIEGT